MTNAEVADRLEKFVENYNADYPLRTADVHQHGCPCQRCLIDFVHTASKRLKKESRGGSEDVERAVGELRMDVGG